jgi:hypothetical protein
MFYVQFNYFYRCQNNFYILQKSVSLSLQTSFFLQNLTVYNYRMLLLNSHTLQDGILVKSFSRVLSLSIFYGHHQSSNSQSDR